MLVSDLLAIEFLAGKCSLLTFHSFIIDKFKSLKLLKNNKNSISFFQTAYHYTFKRIIKKKMGVTGQNLLRH